MIPLGCLFWGHCLLDSSIVLVFSRLFLDKKFQPDWKSLLTGVHVHVSMGPCAAKDYLVLVLLYLFLHRMIGFSCCESTIKLGTRGVACSLQ